MKINGIVISASLLLLPLVSMAAWQPIKPDTAIPSDPFFQASASGTPYNGRPVGASMGTPPGRVKRTGYVPRAYASESFPNQYASLGQQAPVYAVSISGSLKENIERIMSRYHWKVIWKAPYDYNFDGRVTGSSLPNVVEKLLDPFPLQAVMYMSNRTLAVSPRLKT